MAPAGLFGPAPLASSSGRLGPEGARPRRVLSHHDGGSNSGHALAPDAGAADGAQHSLGSRRLIDDDLDALVAGSVHVGSVHSGTPRARDSGLLARPSNGLNGNASAAAATMEAHLLSFPLAATATKRHPGSHRAACGGCPRWLLGPASRAAAALARWTAVVDPRQGQARSRAAPRRAAARGRSNACGARVAARTSCRTRRRTPWWLTRRLRALARSAQVRHWDIVILAALAFTATLTPFEVAFMSGWTSADPPEQPLHAPRFQAALFWANRACDLLFLLDVALQFNLAYYDPVAVRMQTCRRAIARRYLRTNAPMDVVRRYPQTVG
jgi:hypothetical protein